MEGESSEQMHLFHGKGLCRWVTSLPGSGLLVLVFCCQLFNFRKKLGGEIYFVGYSAGFEYFCCGFVLSLVIPISE